MVVNTRLVSNVVAQSRADALIIPFHLIEKDVFCSRALLDTTLRMLDLKYDSDLCRVSGLAAPHISKIRNGLSPVSAAVAINIHELTGMSIFEIKRILTGHCLKSLPVLHGSACTSDVATTRGC